MSVTSETLATEQAGNGSKVAFDFSFKILAESDLVVYKKSAAGVYTLQTLNTHYTVEFDSDAETGTVTFTTAPVSSGAAAIIRSTEQTQDNVLPRESPMPEETIEEMVDRLTLIVQELQEKLDRAPLQPIVPINPDTIAIDPPEERKALVYEEQDDGTWAIVPSEYDPDTLYNQSAVLAPSYAEGLAADRPAAPTVRTMYYSTDLDSLELYIPTSGHWRLIG